MHVILEDLKDTTPGATPNTHYLSNVTSSLLPKTNISKLVRLTIGFEGARFILLTTKSWAMSISKHLHRERNLADPFWLQERARDVPR